MFLSCAFHNSRDIGHRDRGFSQLIPARYGNLNFESSHFARHPADGGSLTIGVGPDGLSRLLIRKLPSWALQGEAKYDLRTLDRPGVLIEDLNDKGRHNAPLQIVHRIIACERDHLQVFHCGERLGRLGWLLDNGLLSEEIGWQGQEDSEERRQPPLRSQTSTTRHFHFFQLCSLNELEQ
jgi:hypothetical protein